MTGLVERNKGLYWYCDKLGIQTPVVARSCEAGSIPADNICWLESNSINKTPF